jgi:hypothetical protein
MKMRIDIRAHRKSLGLADLVVMVLEIAKNTEMQRNLADSPELG